MVGGLAAVKRGEAARAQVRSSPSQATRAASSCQTPDAVRELAARDITGSVVDPGQTADVTEGRRKL